MDVVAERRAAPASRALHRFTLILCLLAAVAVRAGAAPSVGAVASSDTGAGIGRWQKLELAFPVTTSALNLQIPYDPVPPSYVANLTPLEDARNGVSVDCLLLPPGQTDWGQARVQPGFYYVGLDRTPFESVNPKGAGHGFENLYPNGQDSWKVRFAPDVVGTWQYQIRVTDASGTALSPVGTFTCVASGSKGFLRDSPVAPEYFQTDADIQAGNGRATSPIGWNVYDKSYNGFATEMNALKAAGAQTLGRVWIGGRSGMEVYGGFTDATGGHNFSLIGGASLAAGTAHSGRYSVALRNGASLQTEEPLLPNRSYTVRFWVQPSHVTAAAGRTAQVYLHAEDGQDDGFRNQSDAAPHSLTALPDGQWTQVSETIPAADPFSGRPYFKNIRLVTQNVAGGTVYVDDLQVLDAQGRDVLLVGDFERHVSPSQRASWLLDNFVDEAQAAGQYLRLTVLDNDDAFFYYLKADGTNGGRDQNNVFGNSVDPNADTPNRRFQRYYARYLLARWGYSTAVAQWEYNNEGPVYNGIHYAAAQAFGKAIHTQDPYGRRMTGTSFYWNSAGSSYMADLFENPAGVGGFKYPDIDVADMHRYAASGGGAAYNDLGTIVGRSGYVLNPAGGPDGLGCLTLDHAAWDGTWNGPGLPVWRVRGRGTWTVSFRVRTRNGFRLTSPNAQGIRLQFQVDGGQYDGAGAKLNPGAQYSLRGPTVSGDSDWHTYSTTFTLADDVRHTLGIGGYLNVSMDTGSGFTAGTVDVADVKVTDPQGDPWYRFKFNEPDLGKDGAAATAYSLAPYTGYNGAWAIGKPFSIGENQFNIRTDSAGNPLPGYDMARDTAGVFARTAFWGQAAGPGVILWWFDLIQPAIQGGFMRYAGAYQRFLDGIPLANGHYRNIDAAVSTPSLVVLGQKDVTAGRAHFYVYNRQFNWHNVVAGTAVPPVSGTVTIAGLPDGAYTVETWDTGAGTVTATQTLTSGGGSLAVPVSGLTGDAAFKVFPATAPLLAVTLTSDKAVAKPGEVVTYTLTYANRGTGDAKNVQLPWPLPPQTQFVSASGGGVYNAARNEVDWSLGTVAAGAGGSVTLSVRLN